MQERVKPKAKRKKITLEIDAELATDAAAEGIDLASFLEKALRARTNRAVPGGLTDQGRENLKWLDQYVAQHGDWWDDEEDQKKAS